MPTTTFAPFAVFTAKGALFCTSVPSTKSAAFMLSSSVAVTWCQFTESQTGALKTVCIRGGAVALRMSWLEFSAMSA